MSTAQAKGPAHCYLEFDKFICWVFRLLTENAGDDEQHDEQDRPLRPHGPADRPRAPESTRPAGRGERPPRRRPVDEHAIALALSFVGLHQSVSTPLIEFFCVARQASSTRGRVGSPQPDVHPHPSRKRKQKNVPPRRRAWLLVVFVRRTCLQTPPLPLLPPVSNGCLLPACCFRVVVCCKTQQKRAGVQTCMVEESSDMHMHAFLQSQGG